MMMKVLLATFLKIPDIGGASTHIELLHSLLLDRNMLSGFINGNNLQQSRKNKLIFTFLHRWNEYKAHAYCLKTLVANMSSLIYSFGYRKNPPFSIIHSHEPITTCAALRSNLKRVKIVQTIHGPISKEMTSMTGLSPDHFFIRSFRKLEEEAFKSADLLIPVDNGQADILIDEFNVDGKKVRIIENAVDAESLASQDESIETEGLPERYFLVPRRLVPKNGVAYAIRGYAKLNRKDTNLVIAGGGVLRSSLEAMCRELGIAERVRFLGDVQRERLMSMVKRSAAVIVPSVPSCGVIEATSFSVLEAMSCRVPVIGSAIGGIKDIITNDSFGFLVPAKDPEAIASAMTKRLNLNEQALKNLTENAYNMVRQRFGVEAWINGIVNAYGEVLSIPIDIRQDGTV
jgi:glycosyltransferase involved in cell wall biosynthesis